MKGDCPGKIPICKGASGTANEFFFYLDNPTKVIKFGGNNTSDEEQNSGNSTTAITSSAWFHIVGVYDGTNFRIYVNGTDENHAASSGTLKTNQGNQNSQRSSVNHYQD
jgi:hypothetical protein